MNLQSLLAGAIASSALNLSMDIPLASPLYAQESQQEQQARYSRALQLKLADSQLSEQEKNTYIALFGIMNDAKRKKGININAGYHPSILIEGKDIYLHIKPEYLRSPRGASGALRILIYLGEEAWYEPIALDNFVLSFYSLEPTKLSKKAHEVNVNYYAGLVTNMSTGEALFEADILNKKLETGFYSVLKKLKITKKNVNEFLFGKKLLEELIEYRKKQERNQEIVEKLHDHVYETNIHYNGYGFMEAGEKPEYKLRGPKLIEIVIERGEESIRAFHFSAELRYYIEHALGTERIRKKHIEYSSHMNMKDFAETLRIKPEKKEKLDSPDEEGD